MELVSRFERWFILRLSIDPREGDARDVLVERKVARVSESWKKEEEEEEDVTKKSQVSKILKYLRRFLLARSKFYGP